MKFDVKHDEPWPVVYTLPRLAQICIEGSDDFERRLLRRRRINNILAYLEAKHAGADTALLLDNTGYLTEGYGSNISPSPTVSFARRPRATFSQALLGPPFSESAPASTSRRARRA